MGSTLVAYGEPGVQALMHAAAAGLGILFKPCQPVLTAGEATHRFLDYSESKTENVLPLLRQPPVWRTPDRCKQLMAESGPFDFDPTSEPRPKRCETTALRDELEARYIHYDDPYHSSGGGVLICTYPQTKRFIANVQVPLDFDLAAHLRRIFGSEVDR